MSPDFLRLRLGSALLALAAILMAASTLHADPPATRPSHDSVGYSSREGSGGSGGRSVGSSDHRIDPAPEVVSAAMDFWQSNSPNRMSLLKMLPEEMQRRRTLELTHRYQTIQTFKESSPDLFDLLVNQVKLRDEAFQLAKEGNLAALHEKAGQIVDVTLKSRKIRLELLEKELSKQKDELATDSSDPTKLVDDESARDKLDAERLSRAVQRSHERTGRADDAADPVADAEPVVLDSNQN